MVPSLTTANTPKLVLPTAGTGQLKTRGKRPLKLDLGAAKKFNGVSESDSSSYMPPASPSQAANHDSRNLSRLGASVPQSPASSSPMVHRKPFDFEKRLREDYRRCYV